MALQKLPLDENTVIWLDLSNESAPIEEATTSQGRNSRDLSAIQVQQQLTNMQDTIKTFTNYTLNAFKSTFPNQTSS